jgi:hypothetical protein
MVGIRFKVLACPFANFEYTYSTTQVTVNYTLVTGDYITFIYRTNASANNAPCILRLRLKKKVTKQYKRTISEIRLLSGDLTNINLYTTTRTRRVTGMMQQIRQAQIIWVLF